MWTKRVREELRTKVGIEIVKFQIYVCLRGRERERKGGSRSPRAKIEEGIKE